MLVVHVVWLMFFKLATVLGWLPVVNERLIFSVSFCLSNMAKLYVGTCMKLSVIFDSFANLN